MRLYHRLFLLIALAAWGYPIAGWGETPEVQSLDGTWDIVFDHANEGREQRWFHDDHFPHGQKRSIAVLSCWELTEKNYEADRTFRGARLARHRPCCPSTCA